MEYKLVDKVFKIVVKQSLVLRRFTLEEAKEMKAAFKNFADTGLSIEMELLFEDNIVGKTVVSVQSYNQYDCF
jgi:hypothetical protein